MLPLTFSSDGRLGELPPNSVFAKMTTTPTSWARLGGATKLMTYAYAALVQYTPNRIQ